MNEEEKGTNVSFDLVGSLCSSVSLLIEELEKCESYLEHDFSIEKFMHSRYYAKVKTLRTLYKNAVRELLPGRCNIHILLTVIAVNKRLNDYYLRKLLDYYNRLQPITAPRKRDIFIYPKELGTADAQFAAETVAEVIHTADEEELDRYKQCLNNLNGFLPELRGGIRAFVNECKNEGLPFPPYITFPYVERVFLRGFLDYMKEFLPFIRKDEKQRVADFNGKLAGKLTDEDWADAEKEIRKAEEEAINGRLADSNEFDRILPNNNKEMLIYLAKHNLLKLLRDVSLDDDLFDFRRALGNLGLYVYMTANDIHAVFVWIIQSNIRKMGMYPNLKNQYAEYIIDLKRRAGLIKGEAEEPVAPIQVDTPLVQTETPTVQTDTTDKVFLNESDFVKDIIKKAAKKCQKPCHYACLMAVCDDFGLLFDRNKKTAFIAKLEEWKIVKKGSVKPNSVKIKDLPTNFREWGDDRKNHKDKCIDIATCFAGVEGVKYKY